MILALVNPYRTFSAARLSCQTLVPGCSKLGSQSATNQPSRPTIMFSLLHFNALVPSVIRIFRLFAQDDNGLSDLRFDLLHQLVQFVAQLGNPFDFRCNISDSKTPLSDHNSTQNQPRSLTSYHLQHLYLSIRGHHTKADATSHGLVVRRPKTSGP